MIPAAKAVSKPKSAATLPRVLTKAAVSTPVSRAKSSATMRAVSAAQFSTGRSGLPGRGSPQFNNPRARPAAAVEPPVPAEPPRKANDWSEFDRQVLITGGFPLMFHFIDANGRKLDEMPEHAGRVSNFSETEFQVEAEAPNFCQASDVVGKVHLLAKVKAPETEFYTQLAVRSVKSTEEVPAAGCTAPKSPRWSDGDRDAGCANSTRAWPVHSVRAPRYDPRNERRRTGTGQTCANTPRKLTAIALNEMRRSMEAARQAQAKMLPSRPPDVPGYDMGSLYESCAELSGDLYHFFDAGPGRTGILIGDVSGHGVEAAMVMSATLKSFSVPRQEGVESPAAVLSAVNEDLHNDLRAGRHVRQRRSTRSSSTTAEKLTYGRAGHNPALLISPRIGLRPLEGNGTWRSASPQAKSLTLSSRNTPLEIHSDALLW